jgi:hypothetical protein
MRLYRVAWVLWIAGTVLIVLSWTHTVSPTIGGIGFGIAVVGTLLSFLPHLNRPSVPEAQKPISPSGIPVTSETDLEKGDEVIARSKGHWWRAKVVAIEEDETVRVVFPDHDENWQKCIPRSDLQMPEPRDENKEASDAS